MSIEELEEAIAKLKIDTTKHKDGLNNTSMPYMITTFRELIQNGIPPTEKEFIDVFNERYSTSDSTASRLHKAYLSYVREYHLGFLLKKHFKKVVYDEAVDIAGVDYVVYYGGYKFNIHAYVDTRSGRYWRKIKNSRHNFSGEHLDLPIDLTNGKKCGKLILYTDECVLNLKTKIKRIVKGKKNDTTRKNRACKQVGIGKNVTEASV